MIPVTVPLAHRLARAAMAALVALGLVFAGSLHLRAERSAAAIREAGALERQRPGPRLHYQPALTAGAAALWAVGADPETTRANFLHVVDSRPLYGPAWLHLADLEARVGNRQAAIEYADRARALWSSRRVLLWDIARFYVAQGAMPRAMETYRDLLRVSPHAARHSLNIMLKLGVPRKTIAEGLLVAAQGDEISTHATFGQLFSAAHRIGDAELSRALWLTLPSAQRGEAPFSAYMIETGYRQNRPEWVCEAWIARAGQGPCFNHLVNGDFSAKQPDPERGWNLRGRKGYTVKIDRDDRLRIEFAGDHNVHINAASQRVPLRGSGSLRLTGRWRGKEVTTRSGVYVQFGVDCENGGGRAQTEDRYKSWGWQAFTLSLDYDESCHTAVVRIRRNRTDALDNLIGGTVWFDDLRLESAP